MLLGAYFSAHWSSTESEPPVSGLEIGVFGMDRAESEDCDDEGLIPRGENLSSLALRFDPVVDVDVPGVDPADELVFLDGLAFLEAAVAVAPRLLLLLPPFVAAFFALPPRVLVNASSSLSAAPSKVSLSISLTGSDMSDKKSSSMYASESLYSEAVVAADRVFASRVGALLATGAAVDFCVVRFGGIDNAEDVLQGAVIVSVWANEQVNESCWMSV